MKKIMFNDKYGLTEAVLVEKKTQTRRVIPLTQVDRAYLDTAFDWCFRESVIIDRYAQYKESEIVAIAQSYESVGIFEEKTKAGWTNKMFVKASLMPHHIKITNVRIEQLQDINDEDCLKEGVVKTGNTYGVKNLYLRDKQFWNAKEAYSVLIDKISGKGTWESNPYVFVYDFKLID